jgi:hypothetical protein
MVLAVDDPAERWFLSGVKAEAFPVGAMAARVAVTGHVLLGGFDFSGNATNQALNRIPGQV